MTSTERERHRLVRAFRQAMTAAIVGAAACATEEEAIVADDDAGARTDERDGGLLDDGASADADLDADLDAGPAVDAACLPSPYFPEPADDCGDYVRFPCGLPEGIAPRGDCFFPLGACSAMCPSIQFNCRAIEAYCLDGGVIVPDEAGAVIVDCTRCAGSVGRVPAGLEGRRAREPRGPLETTSARSVLGSYFGEAAHLEAASVFAFRRFAADLVVHGAPDDLVAEARRAERDEVDHTRRIGRLARRFGGRFVRPQVREVGPRTLEAIARENAVEGCVRETFGALVASWQATHACDSEIAETMAIVAEDETRHAALSWAVLRWSLTKLDDDARKRVLETRTRAVDAIAADLMQTASPMKDAEGAPSDRALSEVAGLPPPGVVARMVRTLKRELWSAG